MDVQQESSITDDLRVLPAEQVLLDSELSVHNPVSTGSKRRRQNMQYFDLLPLQCHIEPLSSGAIQSQYVAGPC